MKLTINVEINNVDDFERLLSIASFEEILESYYRDEEGEVMIPNDVVEKYWDELLNSDLADANSRSTVMFCCTQYPFTTEQIYNIVKSDLDSRFMPHDILISVVNTPSDVDFSILELIITHPDFDGKLLNGWAAVDIEKKFKLESFCINNVKKGSPKYQVLEVLSLFTDGRFFYYKDPEVYEELMHKIKEL
jgi:hypothetical protein